MKTVAIKQPWASLIIHEGKDIENRSWPTKYRGTVLIHASKKLDTCERCAFREFKAQRGIVTSLGLHWSELPHGGIIGIAEIVDCVTESKSPWFVGPYGFVLANARPLKFQAAKGLLGLYEAAYTKGAIA